MIEPTDDLLPVGYRFVTSTAAGGVARLGTPSHSVAVYLAVNDVLERYVAVKVVAGGRVMDGWSSVSSVREAQTLAQLNHPNIVRVYDLVERGDADLIIMELVSGGTLGDLIGQAEPGRAVRLRLLAETAAGLGYLHRCRIVHRDIKPGNVLVSDAGVAKIADFGLVTTADVRDDPLHAEIGGVVAGTPGHWSPEQARGEPLGPSSDVFSLATVAVQLLGASAPDPRPNHGRRLSVGAVIGRCLNPDPGARPRDGVELHDLFSAAADREDDSWRRTPWRPGRNPFHTGEPMWALTPIKELETIVPGAAAVAVRAPPPDPAPSGSRPPVERLVVRPADGTGSASIASRRVSRKVRRLLMIVAGAGLGAAVGLVISSRL